MSKKKGWGVDMHPPAWFVGFSVRRKRTAENTRHAVLGSLLDSRHRHQKGTSTSFALNYLTSGMEEP